jgi:tetratricopeptide (TPR) repeat protein
LAKVHKQFNVGVNFKSTFKKQTLVKQLLITTLLFILVSNSFGQTSYLDKGNQQLNDNDFVAAEQTFREAIRSDSTNLIYQNQLALSLVKQKKHGEAQKILDKVLAVDSINIGALWYAGTNSYLNKSADLRTAIKYFEKVLPLLKETQGQYYSANWFIGRSYQVLLQSDGLAYDEVSRMLQCYETYVRFQPNANDTAKISAFIQHIKDIRPPDNVEKWINKPQ